MSREILKNIIDEFKETEKFTMLKKKKKDGNGFQMKLP